MVHPTMTAYLVVGGIAAVTTFVSTPLASMLAIRRGWLSMPNARSVHTAPIPNVGGLAMLVGFFVAFGAAATIGGANLGLLFQDNSEPIGITIAVLIVYATGWLDDVYDLPPPGKVTLIVAAGAVLAWFGVTMWYFRLPFSDVLVLSDDWIPLITVLWLLGMTQAINIIDGLDGLAAGIVGIGAISFFLYSYRLSDLGLLTERNLGPLIAVITAGVCLGFLPHNFNPARVFMGDQGALLLGALMAISTSLVGGRAAPVTQDYVGQTFFFFAPLVIPILILGVPIFDTAFAIVRRIAQRQALAVADKGHLHHRLMNLGHGHRRSVLILWSWTALLSGFVLVPVLLGRNPDYLPFGVGALGIVLYTVLHPSVRRRRAAEVEAALLRPASEQLAPDSPERHEVDPTNPNGMPRKPLWRPAGRAPHPLSRPTRDAQGIVSVNGAPDVADADSTETDIAVAEIAEHDATGDEIVVGGLEATNGVSAAPAIGANGTGTAEGTAASDPTGAATGADDPAGSPLIDQGDRVRTEFTARNAVPAIDTAAIDDRLDTDGANTPTARRDVTYR